MPLVVINNVVHKHSSDSVASLFLQAFHEQGYLSAKSYCNHLNIMFSLFPKQHISKATSK